MKQVFGIDSWSLEAIHSGPVVPCRLVEPWTSPSWLAEAAAWMAPYAHGAGEIEQFHVRPWSTVLRVPTAAGDLYFKAVSRVHAFEPALTALLAELQPGRVPDLVAADVARGWLLMRDGGARLRELVESPADLHHWEALLPEYARLQIETAPHAETMLAMGVPDERLAVLPRHLEELLATHPPGLTAGDQRLIADALPRIETMCAELASLGIAETIQHDDLHDGQVFVSDGRYLVFDWGDSCVSHPFHTLTVTLRAIAWKLDLAPGGPELMRLRDAYLEPFGPYQDAVDIAYRTGTIARALAWHRLVSPRDAEDVDEEDATAPAYGLKLFLAGGPIGSWTYPGADG
jgi:phosphotransferase family enzyme